MQASEQVRFDQLYAKHLTALKLQGKADKTIDSYARAVRRVARVFGRCPNDLTVEELQQYFADLVDSHSWSTVKIDRNGLRFFHEQVLGRDMPWLKLFKAPKVQSLLRGVASGHPETVYTALFRAASDTLKTFGQRHKLAIDMGSCAVLHTHARNLEFHPHVHVVVPGGGVHKKRREWSKLKGRYLFNARALAKVFRAKLVDRLNQANITLPAGLPDRWIVDCRNVGSGLPALKYLSRYLYRGVLSERNLVAMDRQRRTVTFRYTESATGKRVLRTLPIAAFLWRIARHVLPRGFRRVREYGLLHHNAARTLRLVQLLLRVRPAPPST